MHIVVTNEHHGMLLGVCPKALVLMQGSTPRSLTAPEIPERMFQADNHEVAAFAGSSGVRRYRFDNRKSYNRCGDLLIVGEISANTNAVPSGIDLLYRMRE